MRTEKAISAFLGSCRSKNLSPRTIEWYRGILRRFEGVFRILPTKPEPIEDFLGALEGSAETRHGYFRGLRVCYRFTWARQGLEKRGIPNPMAEISAPRRLKKAPRSLTMAELGYLLLIPLAPRDRALVNLLIDTGVRIGEAISLARDDIQEESIIVMGKTGEREVPISPETREQLLGLIVQNRQLFQGTKGPMTRSGGYRIIRLALRAAGISGKKCGPHVLRHTFGRQYIMAGGDLVSLQRILGHSDIKTTRIYAELDLRDVCHQHHRFTPLKTALRAIYEGEFAGARVG